MRIYLCILLLFVTLSQTSGQCISIKGIITDSRTKTTIPSVVVYDSIHNIFTTSDIQGNFFISLPHAKEINLKCRCLGYSTKEMKLTEDKLPKPLNISLTPLEYKLNEIKVVPLRVNVVLKEVQKHFHHNFAKNPYLSKSYYSEVVQFNNTILGFTEALTTCFSLGWIKKYTTPEFFHLTEERLLFRNIRRGNYLFKELIHQRLGMRKFSRKADTINFKIRATDLFRAKKQLLYYGPFNSKFNKHYLFKLKEVKKTGKRFLYAIEFENRPNSKLLCTKGTLWIDSDNYSLISIFFDHFSAKIKQFKFSCKKAEISFNKINGKLYCQHLMAILPKSSIKTSICPNINFDIKIKLENFNITPITIDSQKEPHNGLMEYLGTFMNNPLITHDESEWQYYNEFSFLNKPDINEYYQTHCFSTEKEGKFLNPITHKNKQQYSFYEKLYRKLNAY